MAVSTTMVFLSEADFPEGNKNLANNCSMIFFISMVCVCTCTCVFVCVPVHLYVHVCVCICSGSAY